MFLEILTPDKTIFSGEVTGVKLPGTKGSFEIRNNHAPIISSLDKGKITVRTSSGNEEFEINGGIVEAMKNKVVVLA